MAMDIFSPSVIMFVFIAATTIVTVILALIGVHHIAKDGYSPITTTLSVLIFAGVSIIILGIALVIWSTAAFPVV